MEVEFLSNMRYQLMVTLEEWQQWLQKINLFVRYQQKQQTLNMHKAIAMPMGMVSPPLIYDYGSPMRPFNSSNTYSPARLPSQPSIVLPPSTRSRKRSIGDIQTDIFNMLPPHKKMISQPVTSLRPNGLTQKNMDQYAQYDVSPSKRQQLQASMSRTLPPLGKFIPNTNLTPSYPLSYSGYSTHSSSLSPTHLQVSTHHSSRGSPTTSSLSPYSSHSHAPVLGCSPTSLAMQHRNSPYAPVQPVQRLVGKYQPIFHSLQMNPRSKQSLWYSQLAAGSQQPIYNGQVPLSAHGSPYGVYQQM